jgi:hypothetical protein
MAILLDLSHLGKMQHDHAAFYHDHAAFYRDGSSPVVWPLKYIGMWYIGTHLHVGVVLYMYINNTFMEFRAFLK